MAYPEVSPQTLPDSLQQHQHLSHSIDYSDKVCPFYAESSLVLEVAVAAFNTSEWQLSRQLYATLQSDDVVVADSAYGTYVDLALVRSANADAVFRKPESA